MYGGGEASWRGIGEAVLVPDGYRRDAWRLAWCVAALVALGFLPFTLGATTFMNSARIVSSVYPTGASAVADPQPLTMNTLDMVGGWLTEPYLSTQHRMTWSAQTPFWDPYEGYGVPFAAAMQPQPLSPFEILFSLPPPSPYLFDLMMLVRLMVAGIAAALFVRLFAGFAPALAAGVATALGGYFIGFLTQPHLSVEVLIPALLLATEYALRRPGPLATAALGAVTASVYLGGMPESTAVAIPFAVAYALWRIALRPRQAGFWRRAAALTGGHVIGVLIGAAVMLPFAEFLRHGSDTHQLSQNVMRNVALLHDADPWHTLMTELAPLAFGPPWSDMTNSAFFASPALRGYVGSVVAFLAVVAVFAALPALRRRTVREDVVLFLALVALACFAKRMGWPIVQWIGTLPVVKLIILEKYMEPVFDVSLALLAGFGLAAVLERRVRPPAVTAAAASVLLVISTAYALHPSPAPVDAAALAWLMPWFYGFIALALLAFGTSAVLAYAVANGAGDLRRPALLVIGCLFVELVANYPLAMLLLLNGPQPPSLNAYAGAPYITFLQRKTAADGMRVFGTSGTLYPNWSGAFGLYGPTQINALYLREYARFMDAFRAADPPQRILDVDRYTGGRILGLGTPLRRRWLALSSIRYVAAPADAPEALGGNLLLDGLWDQNYLNVRDRSSVRLTSAAIGGRTEEALRERPTRSDVVYDATIPTGRSTLVVDLGVAPETPTERPCAANVRFRLTVEDLSGSRATALAADLHAAGTAAVAGWTRRTLDLRAFAGRPARLRFGTQTLGTPRCTPNALWGDPRFADLAHGAADRPVPSAFHPVLRGKVNVFAFDGALPRASIFHDVRAVPDENEALAQITADGFDEHRTAVVVGSGRDALRGGGPDPHERATIVVARGNRVEIDAQLARPAVVMLNDTFYDGWQAEVDGAARPILRTDYLFRGVALGPGRHRIVMRYAARSVALGSLAAWIGLATLAALLAAGLLPVLRRARARTGRPVDGQAPSYGQ